jgi:hypothetical protein
MRLMVRKAIYRAFPELDSFSNERCKRFVQAAKRPWGVKARMLGAGVGTFLVSAVLLDAAIVLVVSEIQGPRQVDPPTPILALLVIGFIAILAGCGALGLVAKDFVLRRRLRDVLRTRGRCHSCRYLLVGVAVSPTHEVVCPECGFVSSVDASLGELATDEAGRVLYEPSEASLREGPRWLTPTRRAAIRRWGVRVAVAMPLIFMAALAGYFVFLSYQASFARADRPGPKGFRDFQMAHLPSGVTAESPNSWDVFETVYSRLQNLEIAARPADYVDKSGVAIRLDYSSIGDEPGRNFSQDQAEEYRAGQRAATKVIEALESSTIFADIREMVSRPRHTEVMAWDPKRPAVTGLLSELGRARYLARLLGGRMHMAREANDPARFRDSLELCFGLSHMCQTQPYVISWLVGVAIEGLGWSRVNKVLFNSPSGEWLDVIEPVAWKVLHDPASITFALQGDELGNLDNVAWLFEEPSRVRLGRLSSDIRTMTGGGGATPDLTKALGTYWQNKAYFRRLSQATIDAAETPPWKRTGAIPDPDASGLLLPSIFGTASGHIVANVDQLHTTRAGVIAMIRIERYRVEHGRYPSSLAQVEAESPRPLPVDPFSGQPLGYRVVDPATDPFGRGYILYCVGKDKLDDHGKDVSPRVYSPGQAPPGTDYFINDPRR